MSNKDTLHPSMKNLFARNPGMGRPKVLLLGISYPSVVNHMREHKYDPDILSNKQASVDQSIEVVQRGIMTEMDGRDLARCVATEIASGVDAYTVSKEIGAVYRDDRHLHANFNARNFVLSLKRAFGDDIQFSQVILDYYWMPTGWLVTRWAKTLFQNTLPDLVKYNLLTYPSTRNRRRRKKDDLDEGVVYLPFCAHVCKELVGAIHILEEYYSITFIKKSELAGHSLWKGTMEIDEEVMQTTLGKRLDQEEVYCTFRPKDIFESMEDPHVCKQSVMRVLLAIEDYDNIRMIRLRPLRQHEPPSVMKERLVEPEVGGFKGLNFDLVRGKRLSANSKAKKIEKPETPSESSQTKENHDDKENKKGKKKAHASGKISPPKRKLQKQTSIPPKKRVRKNPLYESIEEMPPNQIPNVTYFFPRPTCDLDTYNEPDEMSRQPAKKAEWRRFPQTAESSFLDGEEAPPRKHTNALGRKGARRKLPGTPKENHEYMSFNPRCRPPTAATQDDLKGPGSVILDLCAPIHFPDDPEAVDEPEDVSGACSIFNFRNPDLKDVSRKLMDTPELSTFHIINCAFLLVVILSLIFYFLLLACFKISRKALIGRTYADPEESSAEASHFIDGVPIFQAAMEAARGNWNLLLRRVDVIDLLSDEDREKLNTKAVRLREEGFEVRGDTLDSTARWLFLNKATFLDATEESQKDLSQGCKKRMWEKTEQELLEAVLHDTAIRWLKEKKDDFDPTGELRRAHHYMSSAVDQGVKEEAKDMVSRIIFLRNIAALSFQNNGKWDKNIAVHGDGVRKASQNGSKSVLSKELSTKKRRIKSTWLYRCARKWLKNQRVAEYDKSGEFRKIDATLPTILNAGLSGDLLSERAEEIARKIQFLRDFASDRSPSRAKNFGKKKDTEARGIKLKPQSDLISPSVKAKVDGNSKDGNNSSKNQKEEQSQQSKKPSNPSQSRKKSEPEQLGKKITRKKCEGLKSKLEKTRESPQGSKRRSKKSKVSASCEGAKRAKIKSLTLPQVSESHELENLNSPLSLYSPTTAPGYQTNNAVVNSIDAMQKHFLKQIELTPERHNEMLLQYAIRNGPYRMNSMQQILTWLVFQDACHDPFGEVAALNGLIAFHSDASLVQRAFELEGLLYHLRQKFGSKWVSDRHTAIDVIARCLSTWQGQGHGLLSSGLPITQARTLRKAHPACVSPSPPAGICEGHSVEKVSHGLQSRMPLEPKKN